MVPPQPRHWGGGPVPPRLRRAWLLVFSRPFFLAILPFFYQHERHDAMLARVLAVVPCLSVCLSVTSRCSIKRNERIGVVFSIGAFSTSPTLCFKEIQVSKNRCGL